MALERLVPLPVGTVYPLRFALVLGVLLMYSREVVALRPHAPAPSALAGIVVFLIWIAPDLLWPDYHRHWLFENTLTGAAQSSLPPALRRNVMYLAVRTVGSVALVPIIEELFWRGFLMRWLISKDFQKVPLGAFSAGSFWIVAALFASEHGPYWDVGLAAGVAYNWWLVRTRSLADCILAHAVTNACLAAYVIARAQWQYWL